MGRKLTRREFLKRAALASAAFTLHPWRSVLAAVSPRTPSIKFCGAAGFVSGSSHLLDTGRYRILLDCGLFLEPGNEKYNGKFSFEPSSIDLMILSHAHGDHTGNLHQLVRKGFRGRIVTNDATRDIFETVTDSMLEQARADYRGASKSELAAISKAFLPVPYNTKVAIGDDYSSSSRSSR